MNKPTDKIIREAAPQYPPGDEYRDALKADLQKSFHHHRRRKLFTRGAGFISLLLAMILILSSPEMRRGEHEAEILRGTILENQPARRETSVLSKVEGWTVGGTTSFQATYEFHNPDSELITRIPESPPSNQSVFHDEFRSKQAASCRQMVSGGKATFLGTEDLHIDGIPVRFRKWLIRSQTWGVVVYWQGSPLGVQSNQISS